MPWLLAGLRPSGFSGLRACDLELDGFRVWRFGPVGLQDLGLEASVCFFLLALPACKRITSQSAKLP